MVFMSNQLIRCLKLSPTCDELFLRVNSLKENEKTGAPGGVDKLPTSTGIEVRTIARVLIALLSGRRRKAF